MMSFNTVNIMPANALSPKVTRASADIVLTPKPENRVSNIRRVNQIGA